MSTGIEEVCIHEKAILSSGIKESKIFNDSVHGSITLPALCVAIIDTPHFQRLRYLKQVGSGYFVYPAASHNRFEHCLGVSYLAGQLARSLWSRQEELGITEQDVLCVEVAGLCHDLGHGPYSHLWQNFMHAVRPNRNWEHENASVEMLQHLLQENRISVQEYGLTSQDLCFIQELIAGPEVSAAPAGGGGGSWAYSGRGPDKSFLYDIVANQRNGVDVDKWDYLLRDSHNLGLSITFSYQRLMQHCRVLDVPGEGRQICLRDKEVENVHDMFHGRYTLHRKAYQHRTNQVIDKMLLDAFTLVDDFITFKGSNGRRYKLSDAVDDMVAYSQLTDDILHQTMRLEDDHPSVREAQAILNNVFRRRFYPFVGYTQPVTDDKVTTEVLLKEMQKELGGVAAGSDVISTAAAGRVDSCNGHGATNGYSELNGHDGAATNGCTGHAPAIVVSGASPTGYAAEEARSLQGRARISIIVTASRLNYGSGPRDPITNIRFYSKTRPDEATCIRQSDVSAMLPDRYEQVVYRVMSRSYCPDVLPVLQRAFTAGCATLRLVPVTAQESCDSKLTPLKRDGSCNKPPHISSRQVQASTVETCGDQQQRDGQTTACCDLTKRML